MMRRYNRWHSRFDQPDPYDGSYDLADPQSFNRYAYTRNDPVNFTDPSGLEQICIHNTNICWDDGMAGPTTRASTGDGVRGSFGSGTEHMGTESGGGGEGGEVGGGPGESKFTCITANWLSNHPVVLNAFSQLWEESVEAKQEMGGMFFEPKKNTIHLVRTPTDGTFDSMPEEGKEFEAKVNQYKKEGREMLFIGMFHTHPNGNRQSSGFTGDLQVLASRGGISPKPEGGPPIGFVITGQKPYQVYTGRGVLLSNEMNRCL